MTCHDACVQRGNGAEMTFTPAERHVQFPTDRKHVGRLYDDERGSKSESCLACITFGQPIVEPRRSERHKCIHTSRVRMFVEQRITTVLWGHRLREQSASQLSQPATSPHISRQHKKNRTGSGPSRYSRMDGVKSPADSC